jgi:hypothetical protein
MARKVGHKYQIPFGHHLKAALEELYGSSKKITVEVQDFTDAAMLQLMSRENDEQWRPDALTMLETAKATVKAYADGLIQLAQTN